MAGDLEKFGDFQKRLSTIRFADVSKLRQVKVRDGTEFERQRQHLLDYYHGVAVRHSFRDACGQVFDCVDATTQPALRGGALAVPPPSLPAREAPSLPTAPFMQAGKEDRHGNLVQCPPGTVALRRLTLEELNRFETLEHFLRKSPRKSPRPQSLLRALPDTSSAAGAPHEYAHAFQSVLNIGGHSTLNVWAPGVSGDQIFSLSQVWFVAQGQAGVQTAEAGWQVCPGMYGHSHPVLFTYWTADNYQNTGSYNGTQSDFVHYGGTASPGMALETVSISGGAQAELDLAYLLYQGNWWLYVNGQPIGYYPGGNYGDGPMTTGAQEIDFGGETVGNGSYPPMGSGAFPEEGYEKAAYQRNIYFYAANPDGSSGANTPQLQASADWPQSYRICPGSQSSWGVYFFFGGPGSAAN